MTSFLACVYECQSLALMGLCASIPVPPLPGSGGGCRARGVCGGAREYAGSLCRLRVQPSLFSLGQACDDFVSPFLVLATLPSFISPVCRPCSPE
ncbi:hypothetical protein VULLAG_LOCUS5019 [Vulpes lagopus]